MRRQPLDSSQVPGVATSRARRASAYRPGGGARPLPPVEPQPRTRPVQHHRRHPTTPLPKVLACVQQHVRHRPTHLRRRTFHRMVEAIRQHPSHAPEHPVHAPCKACSQALHAVRKTHLALRLDQEVRVVVLDRVMHHPEPVPLRALAQRLPERPHETTAAQGRHIVQHAQRDQHRAIPRHTAPVAVRHPRMTRTRTTRTGARAATAAGAKLDAGLARSPAAFRCHERGFPGGLRSRESLPRITVQVNSLRGHETRIHRPLPQQNIALFIRRPVRALGHGRGGPCRRITMATGP